MDKKVYSIFSYIIIFISTLGSLYFSEIKHFIPCLLCWIQRGFMYPLVILYLVIIFKNNTKLSVTLTKLGILMSSLGSIVSIYHIYIQLTNTESICNIGIPCNIDYLNLFGFITIPMLCLTAFILNIIFSILYLKNYKKTDNKVGGSID